MYPLAIVDFQLFKANSSELGLKPNWFWSNLGVFKVSFGLFDMLPSLMKMAQDVAIENLDYFNNKNVLTRLETCDLLMHLFIMKDFDL